MPEPTKPIAERIIVALDTGSLPTAIHLLDLLPDVLWWKVGLELFTAVGPVILQELKQRQKRIFLDIKLYDIPNTVAGATRSAVAHGVDMLTLHGSGGRYMLQAAVTAAKASHCQLLAVTVLTSLSPEQLRDELQVKMPLPEYVAELAYLAAQQGLAGAVCSPHEVAAVRQRCGSNFILVTPGIRDVSPLEDQTRVLTPQAALQAGANYLVVGRPVTAAVDPAAAFAALCSSVEAV